MADFVGDDVIDANGRGGYELWVEEDTSVEMGASPAFRHFANDEFWFW